MIAMLPGFFSFAQELNGIWKGTLTQSPGGCFPVYNIELQITVKNNQVSGIRYYTLAYKNDDKKEYLSGDWGGVVMNSNTACSPGRITLHRVKESEFDHIKEIRVDTGTIRLDFYDNGEIDGDTISVTLNNTKLVSNSGWH